MRKRSVSESGRRNASAAVKEEVPVTPVHGKIRKVRHYSSKGDEVSSSRKKSVHGNEIPNSTNRRKTHVNTEESTNNRHTNHNSGSEDNLPKRRSLTLTGESESKQKQEPLPDIMHDWEIIVKSLRENHTPNEEKNSVKIFRPVNSKATGSKIKQEFTDSDKENSTFKKKTESAQVKVGDLNAPSTSTSSVKVNGESKSIKSPKLLIQDSSSPEDADAIWRRPTRSTYKAFEHIFESPELVETLPLNETELNGEYKKEVEALKELLTPKKSDQEVVPSPKKSESKNSPMNSKDKKTTLFRKADNKSSEKKIKLKMIRDRKLEARRITRGMEKQLISSASDMESDEDKLEKEISIIEEESLNNEVFTPQKDPNGTADFEMDFIGFGSPPSTKKQREKSPISSKELKFICKKEVIEEETLMEETTPPRDVNEENDDRSEEECNEPSINLLVDEELKIRKKFDEDSFSVKLNSVTEFEEYFCNGEDPQNFEIDFEGFPSKIQDNHITCLKCTITVENSNTLKEHIKIAHKRVYSCPFDLGQCGQMKGAVNLQKHLEEDHVSLLAYLHDNISTDIQSGKIAQWTEDEEGCGICLMPLHQPNRGIHEILVHGVWPPSLLSLSSVAIDQHVSLWWTGRSLAFACHLCYMSHSGGRSHSTIPIVTSSPHCFPTLLSNHLRNVHLLNLPLIQGWWLMMRLLLCLPASPRRTLSTIVSLGVDRREAYSSCLICSSSLSYYININLKNSYGLCNKCDGICRGETLCWFNCKSVNLGKSNLVFNHLVSQHKSEIHGAWCILCGAWAPSILVHLVKCKEIHSTYCKFCHFKLEGLSVQKKAWHSLNHHTYPCPIPNCLMPLYTRGQPGSHRRLPTARTLLNHLLGQHMPEWSGFTLDQISTLIFNSKKTQGIVLTAYSSQHLSNSWISLSGHKYSLSKGILSPVETVKVPMICLLCLHRWEENLSYARKDGGALCSECTLLLSQCGGGDPTPQCPVFRCLEKISSFTELYQHLTLVHKLTPLTNRGACPYCGLVSLGSPLASITHNLLHHNIACLLCPFTAPTTAQVHAHRATMHGLPSWDALFQQLRTEEYERNKEKDKAKFLNGVVKVWMGENGTVAQWDPPFNLSELLVNEQPEEQMGVINQPYFVPRQSPLQESSDVDPWCSSLCAVSMSPNKSYSEYDIEREVKTEISSLCDKGKDSLLINHHSEMDDSVMDAMSPELLVPSVTVAEESDDSSSDSDSPSFNDKKQKNISRAQDDLSDSSNDKDSESEPRLEIDIPGQISDDKYPSPQVFNSDNCLTVKIPVSIPSSSKLKKTKKSVVKGSRQTVNSVKVAVQEAVRSPATSTKTPTFELVDTLNSVMAETLQSMSKALSDTIVSETVEPKRKTVGASSKSQTKKGEQKGLGDNAFVDMKMMGENILKDLEEKYSGTCVGCGNSIQLLHLNAHIKTIHTGRLVYCSCGFKGDLYTTLVHSFHMSHIPSEARPIILCSKEDESDTIMIVLEARPDVKALIYPCFKCSKKFKQEKSRQLHYNLCKLEKKFSCTLCGEKFALENHLLKHKEWKHNPQTCMHCGKEFNSSSSLTQHVLHIHKKLIPQRCKQCGDTFNNIKQLKVHLRIHSGEQPHRCSSCSLSFISRNLLQKHVVIDHKLKHLKNKRVLKSKSNQTKGAYSSSSDSSDSDTPEASKRPISKEREKAFEARMKNVPLTESDLNTSSSDIEQPTTPAAKRAKASSGRKAPPAKENSLAAKESELKGRKAGIYQDMEVVTLPPLRDNAKYKVETSVGRVCNPCEQAFDSAAGKLLHMYLIHPGLVLTLGFNECSFCDHKFSSADDVSNHHLDKHQRTSLMNGSFRCLCGLVFREDGAYYFHLYYAHKAQRALNIGGEIVCRLCEGRTKLNKIVDLVVHLSDRHTMFDHVRFNDSYMCNFCYKAFESWTVLSLHFFMVHKATKSQTLSYDCPYCQGASPWHSLEALQYHLDNVHRGRHTQSRPVPEHSRSIYTPAPAPSSPTKRKLPPVQPEVAKKPPKVKKLGLQNSKGSLADPEVLYCICQCPYDEVSDMIGCDNPNCKFQWFHFECVGIMAAPEGNWYCPDCTSFAEQKQKQAQKQRQLQADLYEYYSNYSNDATENEPNTSTQDAADRSRRSSSSGSSSNSSNSSSSNSSSSSSSSSDSSSGSGEEN